ncbi:MAG: ribonuclease [Actinomycetota bacterium]|nr:ribonuclease [Actinomycetota bacterium]
MIWPTVGCVPSTTERRRENTVGPENEHGGSSHPPQAPLTWLQAPRDGVPSVVADPAALHRTVEAFTAGTGPVAIDAERASGHRYGQRAFLVQLRREGAGTALIDAAALTDLSELGTAIAPAEWVLHAASQDLPCLAELGIRPGTLFDTELGSRLAGLARVGLAAVAEELLGLGLAKEHSAVDWSTRPLPEPWLRYAALDVEILVDLRDALAEELTRQGKIEWARQEFAAVAAAPPPAPRPDPWRRTSGLHRIRGRRQMAAVRALWSARERLAQEQDITPGRLLPDTSIVEASLTMPARMADLTALSSFTGRGSRRHAAVWFEALQEARHLPDSQLPPQTLPADGPPPARVWSDRDPQAADRLTRCRGAMRELSERHGLPVENLLAPDTVRRLAWDPPGTGPEAVRSFLEERGARPWQVELTTTALAQALTVPAVPAPQAPLDDAPAGS